jgi:hypothetical protein
LILLHRIALHLNSHVDRRRPFAELCFQLPLLLFVFRAFQQAGSAERLPISFKSSHYSGPSASTTPSSHRPARPYLPPLLSLLPASTPPATPLVNDHYPVGYTTSRLPTVDAASIALHHALHSFKPTTPNYAYDDYAEAFNFSELRLPEEVEREW